MVPIMWRLCGCKYMPIAVSDASTSPIGFTRKKNFLLNSKFSYLSKKAEGTTYDCFGALHFWPTLLGILSNIQCISKSEQDGQGLKEFGETCPFFDTCGYSWVLPTAHKPCKSFMWAAVCWQPLFIYLFFFASSNIIANIVVAVLHYALHFCIFVSGRPRGVCKVSGDGL